MRVIGLLRDPLGPVYANVRRLGLEAILRQEYFAISFAKIDSGGVEVNAMPASSLEARCGSAIEAASAALGRRTVGLLFLTTFERTSCATSLGGLS